VDIIGIIFGWYILETTGAFVRFILSIILNKKRGNEIKPFSHFYNSKKDIVENIDNDMANRLVGVFILLLLLVMIVFFSS